MTSKPVGSLSVVTRSELIAMLKLVQRATDRTPDIWIDDCKTAFGWDDSTCNHVINNLRRMAKRELAHEELVVQ